jgi:hypothetical protein
MTVNLLPDLRKGLVKEIDLDLAKMEAEEKVKGRLIWGDYGQGKTHFLKTMEKHILDRGFAVSYLSLNRDLGLSNIHNIYPVLASHLLTHNAVIPGLLNQLTESKLHPSMVANLSELEKQLCHPLPSYIFRAFLRYEPANMILLYNTIMGKRENLSKAKSIVQEYFKPEYKKHPKFVQKDHLIAFFAFLPLLLKSLGYKGWVILIDELEIIGKLGKVGRLNSYKNLSWLLNWQHQHDLPIYTLVASAGALREDVFFGKKKYDARDMPVLARERFDSQNAAAVNSFFDQVTDPTNLILAPIVSQDIYPLLSKLLEIHRQAISWQHQVSDTLIVDAAKRIDPENKPIRQTVRMFIECLDIFAVTGTLPGAFNENLSEYYDFDEELTEQIEPEVKANHGFEETKLNDMFDL